MKNLWYETILGFHYAVCTPFFPAVFIFVCCCLVTYKSSVTVTLRCRGLSAFAVLRTRYDTFVFRYHSWKCERSGHVLIKTEGSWLSCVCLFYIDISIFSVCIHYKVIRCTMLLKLNVIKITEFILIMYYNSPIRLRKWTCQFSYTFNNTF